MLKHRILTALVLIPLVLLWIFLATSSLFRWGIMGIVFLCAWEWVGLLGSKKQGLWIKIFYGGVLTGILWVTFSLPSMPILKIASLFWLAVPILLFLLHPFVMPSHTCPSAGWGKAGIQDLRNSIFPAILSIAVLIPFGIGLNAIFLEQNGRLLLVYVLSLIWIADSAAYFVGRRYGQMKLASKISPGKTVAGVLAGILMSVPVAFIWASFLTPRHKIPLFMVLSLVTVMFSVIGDLLESLLKRRAGVKDSGHWLPGHGGILDRVDSLTAAIPIFAAGYECFL